MELEKQQYLDTFLHIVKGSRSKNEFLKNVQDFDNKFTEAYQRPTFENKASYESFQSVQQIEQPQKLKNPFLNQAEDNTKRNYSPNRSNNFIAQSPSYYAPSNNFLANSQNKMNLQPSRSQQDFFKPPQASKTFHNGFGQKEYEKQVYNNQEFPQFPVKGPQFTWQTGGEAFAPQQPQYSHFEQEMKQNYNDMRNKFANFGINQIQQLPKYQNSNIDLSINSHQNFNPNPNSYGNDVLPSNEFLAAFQRDYESFGKYSKPPMPSKHQEENHNSRAFMMERGPNPFSGRGN